MSYEKKSGNVLKMTARCLQEKGSDRLFNKVLKGMLPKNSLGAVLLGNVYVYDGAEHPHQAQNPKIIDLNALN